MVTEGMEQWLKANKNFTSPLLELNKATLEIFQEITEENLEMISENFLRLSDQAKRLSALKRPDELLNAMKDFVNEDINATIQNSQKMMHWSIKHMEEFAKTGASARESATKTIVKEREREKSARNKQEIIRHSFLKTMAVWGRNVYSSGRA